MDVFLSVFSSNFIMKFGYFKRFFCLIHILPFCAHICIESPVKSAYDEITTCLYPRSLFRGILPLSGIWKGET